jgi:hypothetical protein
MSNTTATLTANDIDDTLSFLGDDDLVEPNGSEFAAPPASGLPAKALTMNVLPTYSCYDDVLLSDVITEIEQTDYSNDIHWEQHVSNKLMRVIQCVNDREKYFYIKSGDGYKQVPQEKFFTERKYHTITVPVGVDKDGQPKLKKVPLFDAVKANMSRHTIDCSRVVFKPYHRDQKNPALPGEFNTAPAVQAKFVPGQTLEGLQDKLRVILHHWKRVFCNDNEEHFQYLLRLRSKMVKSLAPTGIVLVITSDPGAGKSIESDWWRDCIYGPNYAVSCSGLELITGEFNSFAAGKLMVNINEMPAINNKTNRAAFEKFKESISAHKVSVRRLYQDAHMVGNFANYTIWSNNNFIIVLDNGDRRFYILHASSCYIGNVEYFTQLAAALNQENANLMYTYLRMLPDEPLGPIPVTEAKIDMTEQSQPRTTTFSRELFGGDLHIPRDMIHAAPERFAVIGNYFITSDDLYTVYRQWITENYPSEMVKNNKHAMADINSNSKDYIHAERCSIPGRGQVRGYIIKPAAYSKIMVQLAPKIGLARDEQIDPFPLSELSSRRL